MDKGIIAGAVVGGLGLLFIVGNYFMKKQEHDLNMNHPLDAALANQQNKYTNVGGKTHSKKKRVRRSFKKRV